MIGRTNAGGGGGGKKSLILPTNPDLSIKSDDSKLTLSWTIPESEVEIDHYNIYTSLTAPMSLKDMTKVGSVKSSIKAVTKNIPLVTDSTTRDGLTISSSGNSITINGSYLPDKGLGYSKAFKPSEKITFKKGVEYIYKGNNSNTSTKFYNGLCINTSITKNDVDGEGVTFTLDEDGILTQIEVHVPKVVTYNNEVITPTISYLDDSNTYDLTNLTNDQTYYVGIQAVSVEGYENASIWKVENGVPCEKIWVAVGQSGKTFYSTDGETWLPMTDNAINVNFSSFEMRDVAYGNKLFVAVSTSTNEGCYIPWSTDGKVWRYNSVANIMLHICYGKDRFIATGNSGNSYYSTDGKSWVAINNTIHSAPYYPMDMIYEKDAFIGVGTGGFIWYSADGTTWETSCIGSNVNFNGVTYGKDRFIAVGNSGYLYYSTDGKTWVAMSGLNTSSFLSGIAYGKNTFVIVTSTNGGGKSYYSTDGTTWAATTINSDQKWFGVTYGKDRFIVVGTSGRSYYSTDGITWVAMSGLDTSTYYNAVCSN